MRRKISPFFILMCVEFCQFPCFSLLSEAVKGFMTLDAFKNSYDEHNNAPMDPE